MITDHQLHTLRRRLISMQVDLGQIAGAIETIEEARRNPSPSGQDDLIAIAETCAEARDAAMQLEVTANELFSLLNPHA